MNRKFEFIIILTVTVALLCAAFVACDDSVGGSGSASGETNKGGDHIHSLVYHPAVEETCEEKGNIEYRECVSCGKLFVDEECEKEIISSATSVYIEPTGHMYSEHYVFDAYSHWHICRNGCGSVSGVEKHSYGEDGMCVDCAYYDSARVPAEYELTDDGSGYTLVKATFDRNLTGIYIVPDDYAGLPVTGIGAYAFESFKGGEIRIGKNVSYIAPEAFSVDNSNLRSIKVSEENGYFKDNQGVLFSKDGTVLLKYPDAKIALSDVGGTIIDGYATPEGVKVIGKYAFENADSLKVVISEGVEKIDDFAFYDSGVESVSFPYTLKSIGKRAFANCYGLNEAILPDYLTYLGEYAFEYSFVKWVRLPAGLKALEEGTFKNCFYLEGINLPDGLTVIGKQAFSGCSKIDEISLPTSVAELDDRAFENCIGLEHVSVREGVVRIGEGAFYGDYKLSSIIFVNDTVDGWYKVDLSTGESVALSEEEVRKASTFVGDSTSFIEGYEFVRKAS